MGKKHLAPIRRNLMKPRCSSNPAFPNRLLSVIAACLALGQFAASSASASSEPMQLMTNLYGVEDWNSFMPYKNIMHAARRWHVTTATANWPHGTNANLTIPMDADGYPLEVPFWGDKVATTLTTLEYNAAGFPYGTFTLIFEGKGEIEIRTLDTKGGNAEAALFKVTGNGGQTMRAFDLTVSNYRSVGDPAFTKGLIIKILRSDGTDRIRDLAIILPDPTGQPSYVSDYKTQPFWPVFLEDLRPFSCVRFMDFTSTNNSEAVTWGNRVHPTHFTQTSFGVERFGPKDAHNGGAWEYVIQLANIAKVDPWICLPATADDTYIRELAKLCRAMLAPERKLYIELSNEIWNGMFSAGSQMQALSQAQGWGTGFDNVMRAQAFRSGQMYQIFNEEFGADKDRIIKIIAGQGGNNGVQQKLIAALKSPVYNPGGIRADMMAIATYLYGSGLAALTNSIPNAKTMVTSLEPICQPEGLGIITYEGGQHMTAGDIIVTNASPGMYALYSQLLESLADTTLVAFNNFSLAGRWGSFGAWGTKQYTGEDLATAHKYRAIFDWAAGNGLLGLRMRANLGFGTRGQSYSGAITAANGVEPYRFALVAGSLPPGLSLSTVGLITGTLGTSASGDYGFTVAVTDSNPEGAVTGEETFTIVVPPDTAPAITTVQMPDPSVGSAYGVTLAASGGNPPLTWTVAAGQLPDGLSLSSVGVISGTASTAGSHTFTIRVTDGDTGADLPAEWHERSYTLTVSEQPPDAMVFENNILTQIRTGGYTIALTTAEVFAWQNPPATGADWRPSNLDATIGFGNSWNSITLTDWGGHELVRARHPDPAIHDFYLGEAGGNDSFTVRAILPDGTMGQTLSIPSSRFTRPGQAGPFGQQLGVVSWDITEMKDASGAPLPPDALISGIWVSDNGLDPSFIVADLVPIPEGDPVATWFGLEAGFSRDEQTYSGTWFDTFTVPGLPWIYHWHLGWMWAVGESVGWLYGMDLGAWLWTGSAVYPWIYDHNAAEWQYYLRGTMDPRWFYSSVSGEWIQR